MGVELGIEKEKETAVLRGLENKMSYEQIAIITQLSIEEIKAIEEKHKEND